MSGEQSVHRANIPSRDPLEARPQRDPLDTDPQPPAEVAELGEVFQTITGHDSGCVSFGVRDRAGRDWFVKAAPARHRAQLDAAVKFYAQAKAPRVVEMVDHVELAGGGLALIHPWVSGENLNDPFVPGTLPREHPASAASRFVAQETDVVLGCLDQIVGTHVELARQGYVAVEFYDGCILWDFDTAQLHLVDLGHYRRPYRLDAERQRGSARFMAPEEFQRGARIDQPTTVFTLGRTAQVLLGPNGRDRLDNGLLAVVLRAVETDPADRYPNVAALAAAWFAARIARVG